ncbi:DUF262 domain-containing protein [Brachyspira pilosicoli]|uniref:DUF262 domain-containing HNH endonuclease family protein n=1 Tax=Brachyspira pilosicoli TaxID=52584 RepID=A0AAJ6GFB0_BRAPL|nr:DUF262 domain-containing HNH endonuclease family protein [Brachyspira pilosicoli]WIH80505.1 DUF262 domain-containing HNH endonuclease family protein [Brachyspira pilosicoli]WIH89478.1 DUF262 domain-containing HNH endonuclease family protein [Brachyspira pilosicoli]WIH91772.1 DUF262 domain-containing HNH endonuclease family protein [Brachyspira pilosicoli]WIH94000.1 DUF262 domain-containing HNH endonuclease family protein [Brachyspira pilosicoli]
MPELSVSKKTIYDILSSMKDKMFIIPDYQRSYSWDEEKCEILWTDLVDFYENKIDNNDEYFLGTIVTCKTSEGLEIIDGQQRITSITILLRVLYQQLENTTIKNKFVVGLMNKIAPCIWNTNEITGDVDDKNNIHIKSKVLTEDVKDIFHNIIINGIDLLSNKEDLYTKNSKFFYKKSENFAKINPTEWYNLIISILNRTIILPIECDNFDMGLTIFSTLNDRGMPLSDSDIFKAQMYKLLKTDKEKSEFIDKWKNLEDELKKSNMNINDIFRYYTHIIRARNEVVDKEIGLRKFYSDNNYNIFKSEPELIDNLYILAKFWTKIYQMDYTTKDDISTISKETFKYIHCLYLYPNEYWKYIVSVFYMSNRESDSFEANFYLFIRKLLSFLFLKFSEKPTVNYIKDPIFKACVKVWKKDDENIFSDKNDNNISFNDEAYIKSKINDLCTYKISKAVILLKTYLFKDQDDLIQDNKFDVEHIFPRKWQNTSFDGWERKDADKYLEMFGNKIILERKLNIEAGNGFFAKKKEKYAQSKYKEVLNLSKYPKRAWLKEDIEKRNEEFINIIYDFFKKSLE